MKEATRSHPWLQRATPHSATIAAADIVGNLGISFTQPTTQEQERKSSCRPVSCPSTSSLLDWLCPSSRLRDIVTALTSKDRPPHDYIMTDRVSQIASHLNHPKGLLAGQVAIITGSGQGIGAEAARLFANEGAKVVVADIDASTYPLSSCGMI